MTRIRTNAKLNLFLNLMGRRTDGYHEIETIFHGISLGDDLELHRTDTGRVEVEMTLSEGLDGLVPSQDDNIAWHAAQRLIERGATNDGLHIKVLKRIPLGAGLGGGSSNAAGVLTALNELWDMNLDRPTLLEVAGLVGSDVPYCISGGTALATSRGEKLTPLPSPGPMWFVLGIEERPLLTRDVYEAWDELGPSEPALSSPMSLALGAGDIEEVALLLHNDLERAVFVLRPELADKKAALVGAGALGASMSGSGPTMFGIARGEEHAHSVASGVKEVFEQVLVVPSSTECVERLD